MNKAAVCLLLAATVGSLLSMISASNTACFNANGQITQVFCDGRDITGRLTNRANVNKCDCIQIDFCGNVTIKAKGVKNGGQSKSGLGMCQTAAVSNYKNWVCTRGTRDKRWKFQDMHYAHWRPAQKVRTKRCHKIKKLPCLPTMFWNDGPDHIAVDCVLQQCADQCKSCAQAGPGKCDPGMCNLGSGVNAITQETRCNRRCKVDWLTWGQRSTPTTTGYGYMRITDMSTNSVETFTAIQPGYYQALIDMDQCVFIEKIYVTWEIGGWETYGLPFGYTSKLANMSLDTSYMNVVAVDMGVGGVNDVSNYTNTNEEVSFSPAFSMYLLGQGDQVHFIIAFARDREVSTIITGSQHSPPHAQYAILQPGHDLYPNSDF